MATAFSWMRNNVVTVVGWTCAALLFVYSLGVKGAEQQNKDKEQDRAQMAMAEQVQQGKKELELVKNAIRRIDNNQSQTCKMLAKMAGEDPRLICDPPPTRPEP